MKRYTREELYDLVVALTEENHRLRRTGRRRPGAIVGVSHERTLREPLERIIDGAWRHKQDQVHAPLLQQLLTVDHRVPAVVSERDYEVAATVMQWLGTSVGRSFLSDLLGQPEASDVLAMVREPKRRS